MGKKKAANKKVAKKAKKPAKRKAPKKLPATAKAPKAKNVSPPKATRIEFVPEVFVPGLTKPEADINRGWELSHFRGVAWNGCDFPFAVRWWVN